MLCSHERACSINGADAQTPHGLTNSVQTLQCLRPLSHSPGSPFLSKPANAMRWVAPLGSALLQELVVAWATHPNMSGFGCCLKEVPVRLCRPRVCGFSLFLSSSPVKWDCGEETSLCKLLVHSCCWGLYLSTHPSACHHTAAAISVYLVPLLSSLVHFFPVLCLAAAFYSFFLSPLLSPYLCTCFCSPAHSVATRLVPGVFQCSQSGKEQATLGGNTDRHPCDLSMATLLLRKQPSVSSFH